MCVEINNLKRFTEFFFLNFRGLLGGHVLAAYLKRKRKGMEWYKDELLTMAKEVGYRLLPAFNTSTGIPYPRVSVILKCNAEIITDVSYILVARGFKGFRWNPPPLGNQQALLNLAFRWV